MVGTIKEKRNITPDAAKPNKAAGRSKDSVVYEDTRTPRKRSMRHEYRS